MIALLFSYIGTVVDPSGDDVNVIGEHFLHHINLDLLECVDRIEGLSSRVPRSNQPIDAKRRKLIKEKDEKETMDTSPGNEESESLVSGAESVDPYLSTREQIFGRKLPFYVDRFVHPFTIRGDDIILY